MTTIQQRRYDIDWVRVIAIGLLLVYHVAICFQPWGLMIAFITNSKSWESLWKPMMMLNVWRIPLLFYVSGMGVYFAMRSRGWSELVKERARRILIPFAFGALVFVPMQIFIWQRYYHYPVSYYPNPAHLWFLGNIFIYVVILSPLFYFLKRNEGKMLVCVIRNLFSTPFGLLPVIGAFILEAIIINPRPYELYAMTWHGFFLGMLAFLFGFCFVLSGASFWNMISKFRWMFLLMAAILFGVRLYYFSMNTSFVLLVTESQCWIISVLAFGYRYLNYPGKALSYLSSAAYPVYILHMIFMFLGSSWVFTLDLDVRIQFILVLLITIGGSIGLYELMRRVKWGRIVLGQN